MTIMHGLSDGGTTDDDRPGCVMTVATAAAVITAVVLWVLFW